MNITLLQNITSQIPTISLMILLINALIHLVFAGAVAKDAGRFTKNGSHTILVSPMTWAFAVLIGGVFVAVLYWAIHHIKFARYSEKP